MSATCLLVPASALSIAILGSTQSGRTMLLKAPVVIGQTASIAFFEVLVMLRRLLLWTVIVPVSSAIGLAQGPVHFADGHYYEWVPGSVSWQQALGDAANRWYGGVQGHLATVDSAGENAFLAALAGQQPGFSGGWIAGSNNPAGRWSWAAGPEAGQPFANGPTSIGGAYTNWVGSEPNNNPSFAYLHLGPSWIFPFGGWMDCYIGTPSPSDPVIGYFVEYEFPRTMKLMAPVVLGQTASMVMEYPPALAGHQFAMAMGSPSFPGALELPTQSGAEGVLRLDPVAYGVLGIGVLDASGQSPALTFLVPNSPLLVGASFDIQGADLDGSGTVTLTGNDLELVVAAPPPASLNMVAIAAGTFQMGSPQPLYAVPYFNREHSQPVHAVTITRPFWMGKYEVTQAEYQAVMGSNPSSFQGPNRPVEWVTWFDAVAYCDVLTAQEAAAGRLPSGYEYRLPTEAEWEYCCRAGTTTEFHYGSTLLCGQANFWYSLHSQTNCSPSGTVDVGGYLPNAWGLHDMHGNVWEWCFDSWDASPNYPAGAVSDPCIAGGPFRVLRGGSWNYNSNVCRSAFRFWGNPGGAYYYDGFGFRVVCAPVLR